MLGILVIAGTADARQIIEELVKLGVKVTATVTTRLGKSLLMQCKEADIREGRLTLHGMICLIDEIKPICLIDASHPFARDASNNAIEACKRMSVPYLRYERPETDITGDGVIRVKDFEEAVDMLASSTGNVFMAIGSGKLDLFTRLPDFKKKVFARVLPDSRVLEKCEKLGLDAENIFAAKGPFSEAMNMEMLKHCNASIMVTKDSGSAGGNNEKISAAQKLGIPVIMVERPHVDYGSEVSTSEEVVLFVKGILYKSQK